ncbi:putative DNA-binding protein (UPF0251 family) [Methanomicrobium sp. W14]|uniref:DUF134 domain-containing protein n=1 Tax=Methanomicrobium sp. W14 TaxID=2817839 RepID=UPI001AE72C3C|nr:DUF134 domain-containing protein [Methanomicrobium sp. W14]MBP2133752.1 putative DNA-binding protein (UPF0251 family) [Methanomicrobium sp. W14]
MTEETNGNCGEGRCRRGRGRPRAKRIMNGACRRGCFAPYENEEFSGRETVFLLPEEMEAVRLVDLLDNDQEAAAEIMGVSRRTLWRDLHNGRKKIADALVNGKRLEIVPGNED